VLDSNDSGTAHWVGGCALAGTESQDPSVQGRVEWWLDTSALPDLYWALLVDTGSGTMVRDMDGATHRFGDYAAAAHWLREDEYDRLDDLRADAELQPAANPPVSWLTERA
jgi:hypothetical protein